MIMAHAPIIFPTVIGRPLPYRPVLWGPVVLLTTAGKTANAPPNIMAMSWHTMMEFHCAISIRRRSFYWAFLVVEKPRPASIWLCSLGSVLQTTRLSPTIWIT